MPDVKQEGDREVVASDHHEVALTDDVRGALSFQDYSRQPQIAGVTIRRLRKHRALNGWFAELLRLSGGVAEESEGFVVRQLSVSYAEPDRINAFHIHPRREQNELWTVLQGQLLVWLVDCRAGSATAGARQSVVLSAEEPAQLLVPAGVAHGYRAGSAGALLAYAMDQQFDASDPNEGRLPWDHFGEELWAPDRG